MTGLVVDSSPTAQWHALVSEAQQVSRRMLDETLESYLVFLLMRFTSKPELASSVMALQFLQSLHVSGRARRESLRELGDQCLLYSGLFPQRAQRRRVNVAYFVQLGRSAYDELAHLVIHSEAGIYTDLAAGFVALMDVLQTIRELGTGSSSLDLLEAIHLWEHTGSQHAYQTLVTNTGGLPGPAGDPDPRRH